MNQVLSGTLLLPFIPCVFILANLVYYYYLLFYLKKEYIIVLLFSKLHQSADPMNKDVEQVLNIKKSLNCWEKNDVKALLH